MKPQSRSGLSAPTTPRSVMTVIYMDAAMRLKEPANKMEAFDELTLATGPLADEAAAVALAAWRALGCRDAGRIDIRCDAEGRPNFIECNPLAGLRPKWSELTQLASLVGMTYETLIGEILGEALARVPAEPQRALA